MFSVLLLIWKKFKETLTQNSHRTVTMACANLVAVMEGSRLGEQENVSVLDPYSTKMIAWQDNGNYQVSHNTQNFVTNSLIGSTLGLRLNLKTRESLVTTEFDDTITQKLRNFYSTRLL